MPGDDTKPASNLAKLADELSLPRDAGETLEEIRQATDAEVPGAGSRCEVADGIYGSAGVGFIEVQNLIGGDVFEHLLLAPWPLDLQAAGNGFLAEPEIEPHVAGAQVAAGGIDLAI